MSHPDRLVLLARANRLEGQLQRIDQELGRLCPFKARAVELHHQRIRLREQYEATLHQLRGCA